MPARSCVQDRRQRRAEFHASAEETGRSSFKQSSDTPFVAAGKLEEPSEHLDCYFFEGHFFRDVPQPSLTSTATPSEAASTPSFSPRGSDAPASSCRLEDVMSMQGEVESSTGEMTLPSQGVLSQGLAVAELEKSLSGGRQIQKPKAYRHPNHRTRRPAMQSSSEDWPTQQSNASPSRPSRCRDMPQQHEAWRNQPYPLQHFQPMPQQAPLPPKTPVITGTASNLPPSAAVRGDASARVAAPAPTGDASARGGMIPLSTSPVSALRSPAHMPSPMHTPPHCQHRPMPFTSGGNMSPPNRRAQRGAWAPQPPMPMPTPHRAPLATAPMGYQLSMPPQQSPVGSPQRPAFSQWQHSSSVSPNNRERMSSPQAVPQEQPPQQMTCPPQHPCASNPAGGHGCPQTAAAELLRKFNESPQDLAAALMAAQPDVYED